MTTDDLTSEMSPTPPVTDVIAVHPAFAELVDWPTVCVAPTHWALVTTVASREALVRSGTDHCFRSVVVVDSADNEALEAAVASLVAQVAARGTTRLGTMIEPMLLPVARLRERLGVPGDRVADVLPFVDKAVMKRAMRGVESLLPRWITHDPRPPDQDTHQAIAQATADVIAQVGLPAFAKPVRGNSSAGTARLDTQTALHDYLAAATEPVCFEQFIDADVFHLDAVVMDGRVRWFGAGRYLRPPAESLHGAPLAGITVPLGSAQFAELRQLHDTLLGAFARVPDGCTHMEVMRQRSDGRWLFLEVAARTPGWRIPEIHRIHQGVDLRAAHYQVLSGQRPSLDVVPGPHAAFYAPLKTRPGHIAELIEPAFASAHRWEWFPAWRHRTDVVRAATMGDFLGAAVLWNDDLDRLTADLDLLHHHAPYRIEESP